LVLLIVKEAQLYIGHATVVNKMHVMLYYHGAHKLILKILHME
jgi:hypothetical protein